MRKFIFVVAALVCLWLGLSLPAAAQEFTFATDIPAQFGGTYYKPNQIVKRSVSGGYSVVLDGPSLGLGAGVHINALTNFSGNGILFAADAPFTVGSDTFLPRDVVQYIGGSFYLYLAGSDVGIPDGVKIDALAIDRYQVLYLSFDVPVTVGATTFKPYDIAMVTYPNLSFYMSGSGMGFPIGSDVCGFEMATSTAGTDYFFQFRTPTTVSGTTFLPMQIVKYSGGSFSLFFDGGGAAPGVIGTDFGLPAAPGTVPVQPGLPGTPLRVAKSGSNLQLTWGATCVSDGDDYAVYRGTIGSWYSHLPVACSTGGATSATVAPGSGKEYYLVVPLNGFCEGGYGRSTTADIPQSTSPCRTYQDGTCP